MDPAALATSPGNETHLHAFRTEAIEEGGERRSLFLHTSPEFACKKLLAAGERRIFSFGHAFRNRERSPLHHPEFTMLEWYRAEEPYDTIIADTISLVQSVARAAPAISLRHRARSLDPFQAAERITVASAFMQHADVDITKCAERTAFATAARGAGLSVAADDTWSDIFSKVLVGKVEPRLGDGRLCVLDEYPVSEAALARPKPKDPRVAERFEIYGCGVELANGFGELTDAAEQRRRFAAAMAEKERRYEERYPLDEDFLAALAAMPPASGVALGFDRLVMLATGATKIDDVLWTPVPDHA